MWDFNHLCFQVIGFLAALLGKQGNRVDVMRQKPQFIRKVYCVMVPFIGLKVPAPDQTEKACANKIVSGQPAARG